MKVNHQLMAANRRIVELELRQEELESAIQHADKAVERLTAERDAALERAEKAEAELQRLSDTGSIF